MVKTSKHTHLVTAEVRTYGKNRVVYDANQLVGVGYSTRDAIMDTG